MTKYDNLQIWVLINTLIELTADANCILNSFNEKYDKMVLFDPSLDLRLCLWLVLYIVWETA